MPTTTGLDTNHATRKCDMHRWELSRITGMRGAQLRRYQRLGLVTGRSTASLGSQEYTRADLIRLERISFFEFLGVTPLTMRQLLDRNETLISDDLHTQQNILTHVRRQLDHLVYFLQIAEEVNRSASADDWHHLGKVIELLEELKRGDHLLRQFRIHAAPVESPASGLCEGVKNGPAHLHVTGHEPDQRVAHLKAANESLSTPTSRSIL